MLVDLFSIRGVPRYIRSDLGPEFIGRAIQQFLELAGVEPLYIEPGSPWQNGYAESFRSRLRSELPDAEVLKNVAPAQVWPHLGEASTTTTGRTAAWATRAGFALLKTS